MKIIAIDYDDTYTADPVLFDSFIKSAKESGHLVVCVTFRDQKAHPISLPPEGIELFYTGGVKKKEYMDGVGLTPNIWIDDMPWII